MKKTAVLLAGMLAACSSATDPADAVRAALPAADALQIDAPNPGAGTATASTALRAMPGRAVTAGGKSEDAVLSYAFASAVNWGVYATLAQVHLVTLLPPTACTDAACTWGPGASATDLNRWLLLVSRSGAGYDWVLSGEPKSAPGSGFVPVISGTAYPGDRAGHGHGTFAIDFDRAAALDHEAGWVQEEFGTLTATYDARAPLALEVAWLDAKDQDDPGADPANPNRADAVYQFSAASRDLLVAWRTLPVDAAGAKVVTLHTRWQQGGAGRADVRAVQSPLTAEESECWGGAPGYLQTYDSWDGATALPVGDPAACVFQDAAFEDFPPLP